ncbi:MAG: co-chaperone GroES [Caldiserica bacterium]|nr:co-chaperone GroES [Caldisericota bacterium]
MKVRPLSDRVLIKRLEEESKTEGGIYLPETAKEKSQKGEVIAVGEGKRLKNGKIVALSVKKNDKVLFDKFGGTEVKVEGEEYIILKEDDILAVIEE